MLLLLLLRTSPQRPVRVAAGGCTCTSRSSAVRFFFVVFLVTLLLVASPREQGVRFVTAAAAAPQPYYDVNTPHDEEEAVSTIRRSRHQHSDHDGHPNELRQHPHHSPNHEDVQQHVQQDDHGDPRGIGRYRTHHPPHRHHHDHEHDDEEEVEGDAGHPAGGCQHRHHHGHIDKPQHPGETEYAIVLPGDDNDDDNEYGVEYGFLEDEEGEEVDDESDATTEEERDLKRKKGKHKKGKRRTAVKPCGVPHPSLNEVEITMKVLDEWEMKSPGRKQRLLRQLKENRHRTLMQRELFLLNDTSTNSTSNGTTVTNNGTGIAKTLIVKVWFHVMKAGNTPQLGAWTTGQARRSVNLANLYFANSPFKFQLAGVTQTLNAKWFQCQYDEQYALELQYKSALRREGAQTLNVYMCDLMNGQGLWGYAYFPTALKQWPVYDGIVLANPFTRTGTYGALDAHMTFIHELGHWMGLYHTWAGTCSNTRGGDAVFDTAAHVGSTWTYSGYKTCFEGIQYNTCPDNVKGVDPGFDPLLNHMNYVDSPCQYSKGYFSDGQMVTMVSKFETYRYNKTTCRATGVPCVGNTQCCSGLCKARTKLCS